MGHNVLAVSDRDVIHENKSIKDFSGIKSLQLNIEENFKNFRPDLVILGHADAVKDDTLNFLKNNDVKIAQWFLDPVSKLGPDFENNKRRIIQKDRLNNSIKHMIIKTINDIKNHLFIDKIWTNIA